MTCRFPVCNRVKAHYLPAQPLTTLPRGVGDQSFPCCSCTLAAQSYGGITVFIASQTLQPGKKKRGPAPTGVGAAVRVRLQPLDLTALDAFIVTAEGATRPAAIRAILSDWLATHGFLKRDLDHPEPSGPATEAIRAMDEAIGKHRRAQETATKRALAKRF